VLFCPQKKSLAALKKKKSLARCTGACCQQACATRTNRIACLPRAPSSSPHVACEAEGVDRPGLAASATIFPLLRVFHASLSDARAANISRLLLFFSEKKGRRVASRQGGPRGSATLRRKGKKPAARRRPCPLTTGAAEGRVPRGRGADWWRSYPAGRGQRGGASSWPAPRRANLRGSQAWQAAQAAEANWWVRAVGGNQPTATRRAAGSSPSRAVGLGSVARVT